MRLILTEASVVRGRSDGIDALRGIFALWVLFAHLVPWIVATQGKAAVPSWLRALAKGLVVLFQSSGELHPAVLAFIVLSGYCIHRTGFRALPDSLQRYAIRRAFRILPVYYVASAVGIVCFLLAIGLDATLGIALSGTEKIEPLCVLAKFSGLAALLPVAHPCSFIGNAPLATVMVEVWLYVAYAVLFAAFVWRGKEQTVWGLCAAVFGIGLVVALFAARWPMLYNWWQNSSLLGFLPYWWIGTAFLHPDVVRHSRKITVISLAVWLALTLLAVGLALGSLPAIPFAAELRKLAFCGLVGGVIVWAETVRGPIIRPFSIIGKAGYSLYALHAPLTYLMALAGFYWWSIILINLAVAGLVYSLLERPLTAMGKTVSASPLARQSG